MSPLTHSALRTSGATLGVKTGLKMTRNNKNTSGDCPGTCPVFVGHGSLPGSPEAAARKVAQHVEKRRGRPDNLQARATCCQVKGE